MKGQFIYKIVNTINGKFYVGSTTNTRERFRTHRNKLRKNKHHCPHLQAAWNKYGEQVFVFHVVETIPDGKDLQEAEDIWLIEHVGKPYCYNAGLRSGAPWRGAPKEQHPSFNRPKTDEERDAISKSLKDFYAADPANHPRTGKQHTEETKAKISASKKANPARPWFGKTRSEETKLKISQSQAGIPKEPRTYTPEGLAKAQENMRRNAKEQAPMGFADVLAKFPKEIQDRYDFSEAKYLGALVRIENVVCPDHGVFSQYSAQFRKGRGCPLCGAEQRADSKRKQMKESWATKEGRELFINSRKKPIDTPQST